MAPRQVLMTDGQWAMDVLLPYKPYATNYPKDGQHRMPRDEALEMRYIEHSPHVMLGSIVVDYDRPDAALRAFERPKNHPDPSWVAEGPDGRGHLGWWLKNAVCKSDSAHLKPLRYAQRIEAGLRIELGGDPGYTGRLTKNPIHEDWNTIYGPARPYELSELITPSTPRQMPRRPERACGLGRNVTMFDTSRKWAYPMWWHHRHGTQKQWEQLVLDYCLREVNDLFPFPLPFSEVLSTSRSISRWIWRNFSEEAFRETQSMRGKIMTDKRKAAIIATNKRRAIDRSMVLAALEE
ncbi:replication initiation protein [Nocardia brasiliensis]|uniref:replication initiation protein n=1 Tax=Nocardia brasiliensis TaxID=37326 RepID=UPI002458B21A|nr:replication initiation protein [Nocardia brasiliensis]